MDIGRLGTSKEKGGLRFRDVQSFNLAMLAKQCWRLFKEPSSLVSKLLQQKYHPYSNLLDASLGKHPSFAWRSLLSGRSLLKEGFMWKIGNGQKAKNLER